MIDVKATREALRSKGLTVTGYARSKGWDTIKFTTRFYNGVRFTPEEEKTLREDNLLVETA